MQELILELEDRGYSKAADTLERFRFSLWNYIQKIYILIGTITYFSNILNSWRANENKKH